jgi:hypothetical protein
MPTTDWVYPSSITLRAVAQELIPRLAAARPLHGPGGPFPIVDDDADTLIWEQRDVYTGLQQVRGLGGQPQRVVRTGASRYMMEPGYYGEFEFIDERELTKRRPYGLTFDQPVDITDLVREAQDKLLERRLDRIEQICWTLLSTGTFSVAMYNSVLHTDTFTIRTFASGVPWATTATATPLADLRAIKLMSRGYSVNFGTGATAYMNQTTMNALLSNTNPADLGGRRGSGLSTINGPDQLNQLIAMDGLPNLVVYDEGYYDDSKVFQLFVPNNKVIVIGSRRDGDPVGQYRMTRNVNNANMAPGAYTKVVDDENTVPRSIAVHDGHNGGPVLFHPAAVIAMTV